MSQDFLDRQYIKKAIKFSTQLDIWPYIRYPTGCQIQSPAFTGYPAGGPGQPCKCTIEKKVALSDIH